MPKTPHARMGHDIEHVKKILEHLGVKTTISKIRRAGNFDESLKNPRPILLTAPNALNKRLILISAVEMKSYATKKIYLSKELTPNELTLERTSLSLRRRFFEKKVGAKDLRLRNLALQRNTDDYWFEATEHMLESMTDRLQPKTLLVLTYNARSLLNLERSQRFANSICYLNFDILCISETWLTNDVPANSLFLSSFSTLRSNKPKKIDFSPSHGGVPIAFKQSLKISKLAINMVDPCDVVFASIDRSSCIIACIYTPPKNCLYYWTITKILDFFKTLRLLLIHGPLLFTLFVNDLPGAVVFGDCVMYADHLEIFSINSIALHFDVERVRKWCIDNSMQLNDSKCKLLDYN